MIYAYGIISVLFVVLFFMSMRVITPMYRGVVERFGKFNRIIYPGLNFVIPVVETVRMRNVTERLSDVEPQDIITKDNLNARVDLMVYYKVRDNEEDIKKSYYGVDCFKTQIIALAQTTARNVIGDMDFVQVNSQRTELNNAIASSLRHETEKWGVEVVRVELKEITPPPEVQVTMNGVIMAQNQRVAALDLATAAETVADGSRRAEIKKADGEKQAKILRAEGEAEAIRLVNESAQKYFKGEAVELRKIEMTERAMASNAKIVITEKGISPNIILGNIN